MTSARQLYVDTVRSYSIQIGAGLLDEAGELCRAALPRTRKLAVVTDDTVLPLYLERVSDSLRAADFQIRCCRVPAGENSKCAEQLVLLWETFMDFGLTRTDAVVALGGGMIGDLAGFAAATILRGVNYVQIPTTLLAQVDSSVGGKVAIDLQAGKNLAGAFWQPSLVLIDPDCLRTLSDRDFASGMAEVIKYGCIRDRTLFGCLERCGGRDGVMDNIDDILYTCCDIKRQIVVEDERDTGLRQILNFGHTFGHAFELAGNYEVWTHGEGVAAGMVTASELGVTLGVTPPEIVPRIRNLLRLYGLPLEIPCRQSVVAKAIGLDKKNAGGQITVVLLEALGQAQLRRMDREALLALFTQDGR